MLYSLPCLLAVLQSLLQKGCADRRAPVVLCVQLTTWYTASVLDSNCQQRSRVQGEQSCAVSNRSWPSWRPVTTRGQQWRTLAC
jgi:hypothetical protein